MKTKILFVIPSYIHGGTNKSLTNIIPYLNALDYDVSIFAMINKGPYKDVFKSAYNVQVVDEDPKLSNLLSRNDNIFLNFAIKVYKSLFIDFQYRRIAKKISGNRYDLIVAMEEDIATHLVSFVVAPKKIAWVRCDYSEYYQNKGKKELNIYSKFNNIICVSEYTRNTFIRIYPSLCNKAKYMHNIIDFNRIKKLASEKLDDDRFILGQITMISIGRLSPVKQFDKIPLIAKSLCDKGIDFNWYIIGEGNEREKIERNINKYEVGSHVFLLGEKENPYPYINKSDIVCVLSKSEACPNVINEAKILHKPVITTDFGSAKEFITNGVNGIVSTIEEYDKNIISLLSDNKLLSSITENIEGFTYTNDSQLITIEEIFKMGVSQGDEQ